VDTVKEVLLVFKLKAEHARINIVTNYANFAEDMMICSDAQRIQQVLINFYSNALKFTPQGGRITIQSLLEEGYLKVIVKDTGIGISEENQQKLFKQFGFLDCSQNVNPNGIGLGLHICKLIVENFKGTVSVQSELGIGSTFSFSFLLEN
jgi:two-component system sensor histidine kinase/response regulator